MKNAADIRAVDQLLEDICQLQNPQRMREICDAVIRLGNLAPFNAMLVYTQWPLARLVLCATEWKKLGRTLKAEARPLVTLVPFGPVEFVFDVADTDGDALPKHFPEGNLGGNCFGATGEITPRQFERFIARCAKLQIAVLEREEKVLNAGRIERMQDADVFSVEINASHRPEQKFATLVHELAHLFCGHLGHVSSLRIPARTATHAVIETEAELTAYLVAARHGVKPASAEYLHPFFRHGQAPKFSLDAVLVAAGRVEAALKGELKLRKPRQKAEAV